MDSQKRRHQYTLAEKQKIIQECKKRKLAEVSEELKIPPSTIRRMIKDEERINEAVNDGANGKNSKIRGAQYPELEEAIDISENISDNEDIAQL